jgi:hypothetical protein
MTKPSPVAWSTFRSFATPFALALSVSACAGPVGPSAASTPPAEALTGPVSQSASLMRATRVVTTFPLLNGAFTVSFLTADGNAGTITGIYSGQATAAAPGNTTAALDMHIAGTSGYGSAVSELLAEGVGGFVGEGDFSLTLKLSTATRQDLKVTLRGTSTASCAGSHQLLVTQHSSASTSKFAEIAVDMHHEVGGTGCLP